MEINLSLDLPASVDCVWKYIGNFKEPEKWNPIYVKTMMIDEITRKAHCSLRYPVVDDQLIERLGECNSNSHTLKLECINGFLKINKQPFTFTYALAESTVGNCQLMITVEGFLNPELHKRMTKWVAIVGRSVQNLCKTFFNQSVTKSRQEVVKYKGPSFSGSIDIVEDLSLNDFSEKYLHHHKPVIIRNYGKVVKEFNRMQSFDWWSDIYGNTIVKVMVGEVPYEDTSLFFTTFREYLTHLSSNKFLDVPTTYSLPQNHFVGLQEYYTIPEYIPHREVKDLSFWVGPKGTKAHGHQDNTFLASTGTHPYLTHNLNFQIKGHKRWVIGAPEETSNVYAVFDGRPYPYTQSDFLTPEFEKCPLLKKANLFEFELHEGDLLYVPAGYWHAAEYLSHSMSLAFHFHAKTKYQIKEN